jgi:hypothetical protein
VTFTAGGYDDDVLSPDTAAGAIELISTGSPRETGRLIFTDLSGSGGSVGYWNGGFSGANSNAQPDFSDGEIPQAIFLNYVSFCVRSPRDLYEKAVAAAGLVGEDALPDAVPFNDGVSNLLKYAFNMDLSGPSSGLMSIDGSSGLPRVFSTDDGEQRYWRIVYVRRKDSGLVYTPEQSETLQNLSFTPLIGIKTIESINDAWERVTEVVPWDPASTPKQFFHVKVVLP